MTLLLEKLGGLAEQEEQLQGKAIELVSASGDLTLHLVVLEAVMDLCDCLRQYPTEDEDLKAVQILGIRIFNAFGASLNLMLSGYTQNAGMILRDVLETMFLVDLFRTDRPAIARWRMADRKVRLRDFKPVKVRELLDARDGHTELKRAKHYEMLSELAGHPSMAGIAMLRPAGMDAQIGPFLDPTALRACIEEAANLAVMLGEVLVAFFPADWEEGNASRLEFAKVKHVWLQHFITPPAAVRDPRLPDPIPPA